MDFKGLFAVIEDLWPNFRQPTLPVTIGIWDRKLSAYGERTVMKAIETMYETEHFFSFAKLTEVLDVMTKPQLPEPGEVVQAIKKLASNSSRPIDDQPDYIRQTIKLMGGLKAIGMVNWDEWLEKRIAQRYEEAKAIIGKDELKQLGIGAERLGIE